MNQIVVLVIGAKEKFIDWINSRGGVQFWHNANLSDPTAGDVFTPALTTEGTTSQSPRWSHPTKGELVQDISHFKFATKLQEVDRFKIAVRIGSNGFMINLTDASSKRLEFH